jgi:hypothetical protein
MEKLVLDILNQITGGNPPIRETKDLALLSSRQMLELADQTPQELLPLLVRFLKESRGGLRLFEKLMGEHEEENRELVDRFFARYFQLVMEPTEMDDNPLLLYLDPEMFHDLALVQTRETFFKRQSILHINEFLAAHFHHARSFAPGEQDLAWNFFFSELLKV